MMMFMTKLMRMMLITMMTMMMRMLIMMKFTKRFSNLRRRIELRSLIPDTRGSI